MTYLKIGRTTTERLYIDAPFVRIQTKGLKRPLLTQPFDTINVFVATIIASSWISFGILVGQNTTEGFQDGGACEILRGNKDEGGLLTLLFRFNQREEFGIDSSEGGIE